MIGVEIDKAIPSDAAAVAGLISRLLNGFNEKSAASFVVNENELKETILNLISRDDFVIFISRSPHRDPIGVIAIGKACSIYNGGDFGVITELYVDPAFRSKGLGKKLIDSAIEYSQENGWEKLEVGAPSEADWPRTIAFYEKNGFVKGGPKLRINLK